MVVNQICNIPINSMSSCQWANYDSMPVLCKCKDGCPNKEPAKCFWDAEPTKKVCPLHKKPIAECPIKC